jgi:hypothetical protein
MFVYWGEGCVKLLMGGGLCIGPHHHCLEWWSNKSWGMVQGVACREKGGVHLAVGAEGAEAAYAGVAELL